MIDLDKARASGYVPTDERARCLENFDIEASRELVFGRSHQRAAIGGTREILDDDDDDYKVLAVPIEVELCVVTGGEETQ